MNIDAMKRVNARRCRFPTLEEYIESLIKIL